MPHTKVKVKVKVKVEVKVEVLLNFSTSQLFNFSLLISHLSSTYHVRTRFEWIRAGQVDGDGLMKIMQLWAQGRGQKTA